MKKINLRRLIKDEIQNIKAETVRNNRQSLMVKGVTGDRMGELNLDDDELDESAYRPIREELQILQEAKYKITKSKSGWDDQYYGITFKKNAIPASLWKKLRMDSGDDMFDEKHIEEILKTFFGNPIKKGGIYGSHVWKINSEDARIGDDWDVHETNGENYIQMEKVTLFNEAKKKENTINKNIIPIREEFTSDDYREIKEIIRAEIAAIFFDLFKKKAIWI